jgi:hypothetical protein
VIRKDIIDLFQVPYPDVNHEQRERMTEARRRLLAE